MTVRMAPSLPDLPYRKNTQNRAEKEAAEYFGSGHAGLGETLTKIPLKAGIHKRPDGKLKTEKSSVSASFVELIHWVHS